MRVVGTVVALVALWVPYLNGYFGKGHLKCSINNQRLLSLLNLLCNSTQTTVTTRDACYGCFFRAGALNPGGTQVALLAQCATLYLTNTSYAPCIATLLQPSVGTGHCYTGHCAFVQCIRRYNSALLVDECMNQALATNPAFLATQAGRIALYGNATGCILARARCSQFNPITGEYQGATALAATTLQIASNGDIRVVAFPANLPTVELFCSGRSTLDQAVYQGAVC